MIVFLSVITETSQICKQSKYVKLQAGLSFPHIKWVKQSCAQTEGIFKSEINLNIRIFYSCNWISLSVKAKPRCIANFIIGPKY